MFSYELSPIQQVGGQFVINDIMKFVFPLVVEDIGCKFTFLSITYKFPNISWSDDNVEELQVRTTVPVSNQLYIICV